jgi:hypothetical protein
VYYIIRTRLKATKKTRFSLKIVLCKLILCFLGLKCAFYPTFRVVKDKVVSGQQNSIQPDIYIIFYKKLFFYKKIDIICQFLK